MLRSLVLAVAVAAFFAAPAAALPPPNDNFADALELVGASGTVAGTTIEATKQPDEPDHVGNLGGHSIWYRWTAPHDGIATFETCGSDFDTLLAAYTGTALPDLEPVEGNDDACSTESRIVFPAEEGTTYRVAVDGFDGESGHVALAWRLRQLPPSNTSPPTLSGTAVEGEILTATAGSWLRASSYSYSWQRCGGQPANVASGRAAKASGQEPTHPASHAVDGNWFSYWSSGAFAPQWIEVELGGSHPVNSVRLGVTMLPNGFTTHALYGRRAGHGLDYVPLGERSGPTTDQMTLEFGGSGSQEVESILVESTSSPSWIGWREVEVYSTCVAIPGAESPNYRLASADVGSIVRAVVTATNTGGSSSAASSRTAVVGAQRPVNSERPLVTGSPEVGLMVTTTTGSWVGREPITYAYQWQSCDLGLTSCSNIAGATDSRYFPLAFDVGSRLRIAVTATNPGGSATAFSEATDPVRDRPRIVRCVVPRLKGKTLRQASAALRRSRCRLGKVRRVGSALARRGRVINQRPAAGTRLRSGARVNVVVGKGPGR